MPAKTTAALALVQDDKPAMTTAEKIASLQTEALMLADTLLNDTLADLKTISDRLHDVASVKLGVPPGIKDRAERLSDHILNEIEQIVSIKARGLAA
jgi:signal transduction histidine kinase